MKFHFSQIMKLSFIAIFLFASTKVLAQGTTTAAISGTVTDKSGSPLPAATVLVTDVPTGTDYGTTTREDGKYNLLGLKAGEPYTIKVSYVGYATQTKNNVNLELGQNLKLNFQLSEKSVELSSVTVVGEKNAIFSPNRTGSAQNVSTKDIQSLPTIQRAFQDFAKLSPLVSGSNLQVAGRNNRYNNIQIDGTQYNDLFGLGSTGTPGGQTNTNPISLDAIQEFNVVIAPYDVRYGGFTGGGINAVTRSGSNIFKGSIYGFGRNQSLVGKAGFKETDKDYPDFKEYQLGLRLGGPIVKDKLFFFANGELTGLDKPIANQSLTLGPPNASQLADSMKNILAAKGFNAGGYGTYTTQQPSKKLFLRFDYNISKNHKLTLHNNYVNADRDILNNRNANNRLAFDSYTYNISSKTNSLVALLHSSFGNNISNELIAGYTTIRDRRNGIGAALPEVQVNETNLTMTAGPDRYSSANELDQDILELTDNFTYLAGDHILTFGTHNEFFKFRNLFIRSFFGYYEFKDLTALQNNDPSFYQRVFSRTGDPNQSAEFSVKQFGFYAQDEWSVIPNLKITGGVRIDIPTFPDNPAKNDSVNKYFPGYSTTEVPSGNILFSPRVGFNYDFNNEMSTQLRGGVGIFTGRIPYVWMSNNYGNTGTLYAEVRGSGQALGFSIDPHNQPGIGDPGTGAPNFTSEIDLVDPDFKMPQILRLNAAVDHQLPFSFVGTVEFLYSKSINDLIYEKLNIKNYNNPSTLPSDGRPVYGGTNGYGNFYDVLLLKNTSKGYQYNFTVQVQRNVFEGISANLGYTYGRAFDQNSVLSSQARSQMRYNPISGDPNDPPLTTSTFEVRNRIYTSLTYIHSFFENAPTTISLYYNGQSGQPFSYIVQGDLNNDGFDQNDLFYIPKNKNDILLGDVQNGQYVPASQSQYDALSSFIENNDYLKNHRGQIAERNGANNPWRDILDLRIAQEIPDFMNIGHFRVTLDILNVLNLLNSDWGWDEYIFSTYSIVNLRGTDPATGKPVYSFGAPKNNTPFTADDLNSRWAMQLGVRYTF